MIIDCSNSEIDNIDDSKLAALNIGTSSIHLG